MSKDKAEELLNKFIKTLPMPKDQTVMGIHFVVFAITDDNYISVRSAMCLRCFVDLLNISIEESGIQHLGDEGMKN